MTALDELLCNFLFHDRIITVIFQISRWKSKQLKIWSGIYCFLLLPLLQD